MAKKGIGGRYPLTKKDIADAKRSANSPLAYKIASQAGKTQARTSTSKSPSSQVTSYPGLGTYGGMFSPYDNKINPFPNVTKTIPHFKKGGKVKKTGLAKVHKGERVLTAKQNALYERMRKKVFGLK